MKKIDVVRAIGATTRAVTIRNHEGSPARVVVISRTYDTTIDDTWDALTNAERIPRWFLPISGDLSLGGRYQFQGNAGGTITACEPPRRVAATWEFGESITWITVQLTEETPERTRFELEHIAHVGDDKWDQFGPGAVGVGWDLGLMGLVEHLATRTQVDSAAFAAWSASDEGKQFIRLSSEGWCRASIAAGTEPAAATAAAARTTAFYTGEEQPVADG